MPIRLIIPFGIVCVNFKVGDWLYSRIRLHWYGYHNDMNNKALEWFGQDDMDIPPARKMDFDEKNINRGKFIVYEDYLNLKKFTDVVTWSEEDPEYAAIPKMAINNDITLKESILTGNREKERYIFDNITKLPGYYRSWRDRTKPERDQRARDLAAKKPIVYGAPYWNGIKSTDL